MVKRASAGLTSFILIVCPAMATTGVLYSSGGGGGKPSVGFFRTIDEKDPIFQAVFLMVFAMLALYFVWGFLKWMFSSIKGGISTVGGAVRETQTFRGVMLRTHDFDGGNVCNRCGCTRQAAENFGWQCQERAPAVHVRSDRVEVIKPSVYASRTKIIPPGKKIVNALSVKRKTGRA